MVQKSIGMRTYSHPLTSLELSILKKSVFFPTFFFHFHFHILKRKVFSPSTFHLLPAPPPNQSSSLLVIISFSLKQLKFLLFKWEPPDQNVASNDTFADGSAKQLGCWVKQGFFAECWCSVCPEWQFTLQSFHIHMCCDCPFNTGLSLVILILVTDF